MNQNKNKCKLFYSFEVECLSPISVGNGDNEITEHDVIRYFDGSYYLPASTLAGCLFSRQKDSKRLYSIGFTKEYMFSPLFVSDGVFNKDTHITKRDGNKLDYDTKTALNTAVFNYEALEKGSIFEFFIEYTLKDDSSITKEEIRKDILEISSKINEGIYRIGFKQNRGLGKLKIKSLKERMFDFDNANFKLDEYMSFLSKSNQKLDKSYLKDITNEIKVIQDERDCIIAELRPVSLINIRTKSRLDGETDTCALTLINNKNIAVIPGSSINGALRSYAYKLAKKDHADVNIFRDLNKEDIENSTRYIIDDLYIKGKLIKRQRTSVNRITGGADNTALFDSQIFMPNHLMINEEQPVKLKITFYDDCDSEVKKYMTLALEGLCNGNVALGGETSIGYGIFEGKIIEGGK